MIAFVLLPKFPSTDADMLDVLVPDELFHASDAALANRPDIAGATTHQQLVSEKMTLSRLASHATSNE